MFKKKHNKKNRGIECLNCGQPLHVDDRFCSNCGQKNDVRKPQLFNLLDEFFSSFYSLNSRFLRTIIPLLFKPGKVTADFFAGKRLRYMNPFRFYINVSIIFFLIQGIIGFFESMKYEEIANDDVSVENTIKLDSVNQQKLDSILVAENVDKKQLDSARNNINFNLSENSPFFKKIDTFQKFYRENRVLTIDAALDTLNYPQTFENRFLYKKARDLIRLTEDKKYQEALLSKINSNISIALFVMLPFFALFYKLVYIRRKFSYMEHLVFIFHTQSVFFLMLIFFFLFDKIFNSDLGIALLTLTFGFYLYKAMRFFYNQNRFITFLKYGFVVTVFFVLSLINLLFISIFSFATN